MLVLGIDTCGPAGSVALGRLDGHKMEILGQIELEGRTYSATLVAAIGKLLKRLGTGLKDVGCMVVVNGPGSFTGVRVGLSAVKGLAEGTGIPVVAVSRLEVLRLKAGVLSAALDAHRHEVFLRVETAGPTVTEMLAGVEELSAIGSGALRVAVCDEAAGALLAANCPGAELMRVKAPTAADALELAAGRVQGGDFADVALLDGHYLRRSDAEIFGAPVEPAGRPA
jgi:tRNA threonylcarbamoyladenosine biosynthesis protein TsaB